MLGEQLKRGLQKQAGGNPVIIPMDAATLVCALCAGRGRGSGLSPLHPCCVGRGGLREDGVHQPVGNWCSGTRSGKVVQPHGLFQYFHLKRFC